MDLTVTSVMRDFMDFLTVNLVTATPWVQVGVCVDQLVTSVHVNPITLVQSVISVPQDILVFQTAAGATVTE